MSDGLPDSFDVIVLGTGLPESIVAGYERAFTTGLDSPMAQLYPTSPRSLFSVESQN